MTSRTRSKKKQQFRRKNHFRTKIHYKTKQKSSKIHNIKLNDILLETKKASSKTLSGKSKTENIFSLTNSNKLTESTTLANSSKQRKIKLLKLIKKQKHARKITPMQYCANYKNDMLGKSNKQLYESCKINQYCRANKCNKIDQRFDTAKRNKLGVNANALLFTSINKMCPITLSDKSRKRCYNNATRKFYEDNKLGDIYNQVLECDKNTCAKERNIFYSNLFRANKTKKKIHIPKIVNMEELADKETVENN
jgi:hypothetical protein